MEKNHSDDAEAEVGAEGVLGGICYDEPSYDYDEEAGTYNIDLTKEEINILAILMKMNWLDR